MVVKQKVGRKRYIGFEVIASREIPKTELIRALRLTFDNRVYATKPWLVKYRKNKGLLRCMHKEKALVIKTLTSIRLAGDLPIQIKTLGTSGTIKCATRKYMKDEC